MAVLYVDNDNLIKISDVEDAVDGSAVSDMAGTVDVYDQDDSLLANASGLAIAYASGASPPFYYAEVPDTVQLTKGTKYKVVFQSSNYGVKLTKYFKAEERTG